ncbi:zinc finger CW-type PWWP domain protein 2 isoform X1 [Ochotona curzoniae]|uniref:zinc finger CW-type PWWP domain protein 2 isoform X1 n=1 Tax=Ochotona curzoniae TaxID=130825 RepID=UPI001B34C36D|nr:zinc finger CW-type PWWP domain protein 2 isoform X1 [Ochotona curzoniae]XP_040819777.1 zinc finger CW-type PWWP domain protein 2 isoform X1 [Ochotona curzoniae]
MESSVESKMYANKVWVQCENESCLKWRLLSSEDAAEVDCNEPWYCFMNTDTRYNKCCISEEDFPQESQLSQSGFKIVYSQLPLGSLVLVKLQSWPSWPGILCPDPFKGKYVTYDMDGNVDRYHIEFLGDPHSRSWINATFVGHCSMIIKPGECKTRKKWYMSALQEAHLLYGLSHEQRLRMCCLANRDKSKTGAKVAMVAKKRMQISQNNTEKKKPKPRKRKREASLKCSFENVCSDEALSKENMVVSETEVLLEELEQMLQQVLEPPATADKSEGCGEELNAREKLSKYSPEAPAGRPFESHCEEDYLVIDGIKLKPGECIESISNKFKEIDALMSEF